MRDIATNISKWPALFYHPAFLEHDTGQHPESASRLKAILAKLEKHRMPQSALLEPEPVDITLLSQVHDPRYIAAVERASAQGGGYWDYDTYISPGSYRAATLAAGAAVAAIDSALSGRNGFALVRPPGHHALYDSAMGFCLFNNVAVAAQHAIVEKRLERVLIVDWDVHHGNGTQDYFYERDDILFFSVHQYPFYPGTGSANQTGSGAGKGYTVNVPLRAGVGDEGYKRVLDEILTPVARRFKPELIVVSAGYDAHMADPIGGMAVSVAGFYSLAERVWQLSEEIAECGGRVACVLEGGYNVEALAASVVATIAALGQANTMYDPQAAPPQTGVNASSAYTSRREPDVSPIIDELRRIHGL